MSDAILKINRKELTFDVEIGRGGFSTVFRALWCTNSKEQIPVAAKRLNSPEETELELLSRLKHPNIIRLFGYVDTFPEFYLILELCEGGSLRSFLDVQNKNPLHLLVVCSWGEQATLAVQYLQEHHVIHRDIKSPNFLISRDKNLKLCDFGLSKEAGSTVSTAVKGTWGWTAPEIFKEEHLSPYSDIYALATVIWELISLQEPFKGCDYVNVMYRVGRKGERPEIPSECPEELARLLRQCWKEDRKERATLNHILDVLKKLIEEIQAVKNPQVEKCLKHLLPRTILKVEVKGTSFTTNQPHGRIIADIKQDLQKITGILPENQVLKYNGSRLEDHKTLVDYCIYGESTINCEEFLDVHVKSSAGNQAACKISASETIGNIKSVLVAEAIIPSENCLLIRNNKLKRMSSVTLEDHRTPADYNIQNGDVLHCQASIEGTDIPGYCVLENILEQLVAPVLRDIFKEEWNKLHPTKPWNDDSVSSLEEFKKLEGMPGTRQFRKHQFPLSSDHNTWDLITLFSVLLYSNSIRLQARNKQNCWHIDEVRKIKSALIQKERARVFYMRSSEFGKFYSSIQQCMIALKRPDVVESMDSFKHVESVDSFKVQGITENIWFQSAIMVISIILGITVAVVYNFMLK